MNRSIMKLKILLFSLFSFVFLGSNLFAQVKMTEESWVLPTYQVLAPEKAPIFFTDENYQGAARHTYPYALNDVISNEKEMHGWKALKLENKYIELPIRIFQYDSFFSKPIKIPFISIGSLQETSVKKTHQQTTTITTIINTNNIMVLKGIP